MTDIHLHDPQTLYRHWEEQQWNPFAIDLEREREQWQQMSGDDRGLVHWVPGRGDRRSARDRRATPPAPASSAPPPPSPPSSTRGWPRPTSALSPIPATRRPRSRSSTYHLVIESTLGLTAFRFITRHLEREGLLPGFVAGYSCIHHDEQRHIGYGVWYLRDAVARDPALADEVRATLTALLPAVVESLTLPDRRGTDWDALGARAQEIREFALGGLIRRLKLIGAELG